MIGDFVYKVTHPKHEINKTYVATVNGKMDELMVQKLRKGVRIEDYTTSPAKVNILEYDEKKNITKIEITIHEGKNRQVRKMLAAVGKDTIKLERIKIGNLDINGLKYGEWRLLNRIEVDNLLN